MYDIDLLEKQWEVYNKRKKYPLFLMVAGLFFAGSLGYYWMINHHKAKSGDADVKSLSTNNKKGQKYNVASNILLNKSLKTIDKYNRVDIDKTKRDNIAVKVPQISLGAPLAAVEDIPILDEKPDAPRVHVGDKVRVRKKKKKVVIHIQKTTSVSAYKDVERRFNQSHDIDDSLFLARGYYAKGEYRKATFWALQTNKLNSKIDDSWIIFIKSKVKLGEKNEAIHILESYVKKSNSYRAKKLLEKLQNVDNAI